MTNSPEVHVEEKKKTGKSCLDVKLVAHSIGKTFSIHMFRSDVEWITMKKNNERFEYSSKEWTWYRLAITINFNDYGDDNNDKNNND